MPEFSLLIEPRNAFSLATVAVASNLAYLNLPAFGFKNEIVRHARPIYDGIPKSSEIEKNFWFQVLEHLAGLDETAPPLGDKNLNWDFLNTYNKWFSSQKDRRMMTGLLWYAISYIVLSAIQAIWTWKPEFQCLSGAMTFVTVSGAAIAALWTYKVGDPSDNADRPNLKMLYPLLTIILFSIVLLTLPISWINSTPPEGLYWITGIFAYVASIAMLILCIVTPITMIRRGKAMVKDALSRTDFCNAQLIAITTSAAKLMASDIMEKPIPPAKI